MMVGEGEYRDTNSQLNYLPGAYPQISAAALRAWKKLPNSDKKTEDLSKIRQGQMSHIRILLPACLKQLVK